MQRYFELANDPSVRKNAFNSDPVEWETHVNWYTKRLKSDTSQLFAAFSLEGEFVGQVRFDFVDGAAPAWEIDFSIVPSFRGQGLGVQLLWQAMRLCSASRQESICFRGLVKANNLASARTFEKLGFQNMQSGRYAGNDVTEYFLSPNPNE
jgi:RimJ/RimL family protein N-acetyltransferase